MGRMDQLALGDLSPVVRKTIVVPPPAAAAEFTTTVPGDQVWNVLAVRCTFTTSAVVGARQPAIQIGDGVQQVLSATLGPSIAASIGVRISYVPGMANPTTNLVPDNAVPLPPVLVLGPGFVISSLTGTIQAGDQYSGITVWIEQQLSGVTALSLARQAAEDVYDEPTAFL